MPVEAPASAVPAEDGFRSDEHQMLLPGRAESANHEPEESIPALEGTAGPRAECDLELVAQEQVLDHKVVPLTEKGSQSREEDAKEFKHPGRVADQAGRCFARLHPLEAAEPVHINLYHPYGIEKKKWATNMPAIKARMAMKPG